MKTKKTLALKFGIFALLAAAPFAQGSRLAIPDYRSFTSDDYEDYDLGDNYFSTMRCLDRMAISAELFAGMGTGDWEDTNPSGFTVTFSQEFGKRMARTPVVVPVGFFSLRGGYYEEESGEFEGSSVYVGSFDLGLRAGIFLNNHFALYVGGRIGYGYATGEKRERGRKEFDESFAGLSVGLGAGVEFSFNERHSVSLGVEDWMIYFSSKSNDNAWVEDMPDMSMVLFSLGYKYSF